MKLRIINMQFAEDMAQISSHTGWQRNEILAAAITLGEMVLTLHYSSTQIIAVRRASLIMSASEIELVSISTYKITGEIEQKLWSMLGVQLADHRAAIRLIIALITFLYKYLTLGPPRGGGELCFATMPMILVNTEPDIEFLLAA